jgi:hypothetical protein
MNYYTVKLRYKNSDEINYSNDYVIRPVKEIRSDTWVAPLNNFLMPLDKAKSIMKSLIERNKRNFINDSQELDYISVVELSNYPPHGEFSVLEFKEFK